MLYLALENALEPVLHRKYATQKGQVVPLSLSSLSETSLVLPFSSNLPRTAVAAVVTLYNPLSA